MTIQQQYNKEKTSMTIQQQYNNNTTTIQQHRRRKRIPSISITAMRSSQ